MTDIWRVEHHWEFTDKAEAEAKFKNSGTCARMYPVPDDDTHRCTPTIKITERERDSYASRSGYASGGLLPADNGGLLKALNERKFVHPVSARMAAGFPPEPTYHELCKRVWDTVPLRECMLAKGHPGPHEVLDTVHREWRDGEAPQDRYGKRRLGTLVVRFRNVRVLGWARSRPHFW